jgi:hypothetical protein
MKPIPQIDPIEHTHRSFPLTDYNFHANAETQTSSSATLSAAKSPAFHKISGEFFGAEAIRNHIVELFLFVLIAGLSAWPIISMIVALIRLVRNY